MSDPGRPADKSPLKTKVVRAQKIVPTSAATSYDSDESSDRDRERERERIPGTLPRSHTPGHLASRSTNTDRRRATADLSSRQRAQSASHAARPATSSNAKPPPLSIPPGSAPDSEADESDRHGTYGRKSVPVRSASAKVGQQHHSSLPAIPIAPPTVAFRKTTSGRRPITPFPPLKQPEDGPDVPAAPASGMYWSRAMVSGVKIPSLRAHTTTPVGSNIYVFGGCDSKACFNDVYVLDADSFFWSQPRVVGDIPSPLRAMTCTAVGKKLVVFGGGDGPAYYNDVYVLDTVNFRWTKPRIVGDRLPSKRRAHTACLYRNGIYIFGGGDGVRALNDVWRLDVSDMNKMSWKLISAPEKGQPKQLRPKARGYHTANMVGGKLIIFGGSDGGECFDDVWVYDVEAHIWKAVTIPTNFRRLSHTATIVGSYLFVIGGHDGSEYSNDVLLLNLVTMTWDKRKTYGSPLLGRGYHGAVIYDSRLIILGGFDGGDVFDDVMILELAVHSYYSQISHFSIDV